MSLIAIRRARLPICWLFAVAATPVWFEADPSLAWTRHGIGPTVPSANCPQAIDAGCADALAKGGLFNNSAFFTTAVSDGGANILASHPMGFNAAGAEKGYGVGHTAAATVDPLTASYDASLGCGASLTGSANGGPLLDCRPAAPGYAQMPSHLDFTSHGGWEVIWHLENSNASAGADTLKMVDFQGLEGSSQQANVGWLIINGNGKCPNVDFEQFSLTGNPTSFPTSGADAIADNRNCGTSQPMFTTFKNFDVHHLGNRMVSGQQSGLLTMTQFYAEDINADYPSNNGRHAELEAYNQGNGASVLSVAQPVINDCTFIQPASTPNPSANAASPFETSTTTNTNVTQAAGLYQNCTLIINAQLAGGGATFGAGLFNNGGVATYTGTVTLQHVYMYVHGALNCYILAGANTPPDSLTDVVSLGTGAAITGGTGVGCPGHA